MLYITQKYQASQSKIFQEVKACFNTFQQSIFHFLEDYSSILAQNVFVLLFVGKGSQRGFAVRKRECQNHYTPSVLLARNIRYSLINLLTRGKDKRFEKYSNTVYLMYGFTSSVIFERVTTVQDLKEQYQDDLPMLVNAEAFFSVEKKM